MLQFLIALLLRFLLLLWLVVLVEGSACVHASFALTELLEMSFSFSGGAPKGSLQERFDRIGSEKSNPLKNFLQLENLVNFFLRCIGREKKSLTHIYFLLSLCFPIDVLSFYGDDTFNASRIDTLTTTSDHVPTLELRGATPTVVPSHEYLWRSWFLVLSTLSLKNYP